MRDLEIKGFAMSRAVPGPVKAISCVYGLNGLLYLLVSGFIALELFFFVIGATLMAPGLLPIELFGILITISLFLGGMGMANWFVARSLWRGSRLGLFFALAFSFLQVLGSTGALLAGDFDQAFLPVFAFHVFCLAYLGFNKKVRRAFT